MKTLTVTAADLEADEMIRACFKRNLPHLPVITELSDQGETAA